MWVVQTCCVSGDRPLLAEAAVPGVDALYELTTAAPWLARVTALESSLIVGTLKDGGLFSC